VYKKRTFGFAFNRALVTNISKLFTQVHVLVLAVIFLFFLLFAGLQIKEDVEL